MARLCEKLDNYHWNMTLGMADDYPATMADKVASRLAMEYCRKPTVCCCADLASLKEIYEMAVLCQGGIDEFERHPYLLHLADPVSPLLYYDPVVEKIIFCAEKKIPLINFPGIQSTGTAPATLAGTIVQASAESLPGLVLHQAANPGAPFIYGAFSTIMDMKTTVFSYGAIEMALMVSSLALIAQRYRLPFFGTAGCTDSQVVDMQAAVEGSLQDLISASVGEGLVHDTHCWLDHGSTVSPAYFVLGQDILGMVKKFMNGVSVTDNDLALDVIEKVGSGGNFLREKHTMKNFKNMFYPELFERTQYEIWLGKGGQSIENRLREKTLKLIKSEDVNRCQSSGSGNRQGTRCPPEKLGKMVKLVAPVDGIQRPGGETIGGFMNKAKRNIVLVILSMIAGLVYLTPFLRFSFYDQMVQPFSLPTCRSGRSGPCTACSMFWAICPVVFWPKNSIPKNSWFCPPWACA